MLTKWVLLAVLIIATVYFCISLYKYFKQRKVKGNQKKFWLIQGVVSFICIILSSLRLYKIKKEEEKNGKGN